MKKKIFLREYKNVFEKIEYNFFCRDFKNQKC